nr:probable G-protein coupled receptor Mth-like 7 [Drosophila takahashii]
MATGSSEEISSQGKYCLYPQFDPDYPETIWVDKHCCDTSVQRNYIESYSRYFVERASILWFSAISFYLWKLLTSMRREVSRYQFHKYSAFVWGTSALLTGIIYVMNLVWEKDLSKWNWMPLVGYAECTVKVSRLSAWIYILGPHLILATFNMIMFILTTIHIRKTSRELQRFKQNRENTITCLSFDYETYLMFLRLSVIMGAAFILDFTILVKDSFLDPVFVVTSVFDNHFGVFIFVLLILKRSTLKLLMERFRACR